MAKQKIVLAYSGGLDTSIIIPWLKENYDCEVIAVAVDVGQGEELAPLHEKARKSGAEKLYIVDLKDEFVTDYIWPTLKAGAMYENTYLLGTSMARPPIAKALVDVAHAEGAAAIAHGCTGKGNDQVRFELTIKALDPSLKIIAPWRIWDIKSREEAIDYAAERGIPVPVSKARPYSMDRNLWHLSHEGADLEDPANAPPDDLYMISQSPKNAPDEAEVVSIGFEAGIPVSVNGEALAPVALIEKLNAIGAKHGVGIDDMVENRLVGMKSRGVYENPAGTMLYAALKQLESICLDRDTLHYKHQVALRYSELVYNGQWFAPLREGLDAFMNSIHRNTTGESKLELYKGCCYNAGVTSPYSLFNPEFATFGEDAVYNQKDAEGFINLFGLPMTVAALMKQSLKK